uniref:FYVE-type domain-containing protein n=1 Tax=Ditylenchus dipsaci TaxID=166011 RepID=A0A915CYU8_9BILA
MIRRRSCSTQGCNANVQARILLFNSHILSSNILQIVRMQASNHTIYFNHCRNQCINKVASRTNSLIIRLDKLVNIPSDDETNRKGFERTIVSWSEDSDFLKCPACNAKFSLTKRKHHCRLCGKIMCQPCSQYLTITSARKLVGPGSYMLGSPCRSGEDLEDRLRVCDDCKHLLDKREKAMDLRTGFSAFVDVYQELCTQLSQVKSLAPSYKRMAESINKGEMIYSASAANELEKKLSTIHHKITFLGEQIEQWGVSSGSSSPSKRNVRELVLQRNIKILALNSLNDAIAAMPEISIQCNQSAKISEASADEHTELNVVQQQYLNIKSYLADAAHSGRLEEVEILEKSLAELGLELRNMDLPTPGLLH